MASNPGPDPHALEALYDACAGQMQALALRITGDARSAEEVVYESFLELWRTSSAATSAENAAVLSAQLMLALRRRALDRRPPVIDPAAHAAALEAAPQAQALSRLPLEDRLVLDLSYFDGLSVGEISERIAAEACTVRSRLAHALETLRGPRAERGNG